MSKQNNREMIGEIRFRMGAVPRGGAIDSLVWATELAYGYSRAVSEVRELVRSEADAATVMLLDG